MKARKNAPIPRLRGVKKGDSLKTIYAKARKAFTADDLARFFQDEEMVPANQVVAELEANQGGETRKRRRSPKRKT